MTYDVLNYSIQHHVRDCFKQHPTALSVAVKSTSVWTESRQRHKVAIVREAGDSTKSGVHDLTKVTMFQTMVACHNP